ncbi:L-seryl-tRNA(Ser) seleniumtransferase [Desulfobaculum xiamenense]|uniref:L-seryl-tRNA(Sec) selenium transferase n=1 Tax=Desulfobaculum xiamenense TaxID=995050 RepID=A0A846QRD2_9BACT|nr:L-seryl-tRNA(Sec) selenium transferase [Desulfobaculum xiamenense]NJB67754.1 L-seryl-tRNA(Ser) seleniumtransferase [Desulfobaculum xiamenense]
MQNLYRQLPSVDAVLQRLDDATDISALPRTLVRGLVNDFLDSCRDDIRNGRVTEPASLTLDALAPALTAFVRAGARPHFRRVLNATGVVIHTNLGRSILAPEASVAVAEACAHYSNLEFDLATGERGSRYSHVEDLLCRLTGAEAALVVNNNAAAVLIVLETLAKGGEVPVSRGQLVEIGGSFRIPEIMAKSGATLVEVGATNRTHLRDYERVINESTSALLRVHTSNFRIVGFTSDVPTSELAELGHRHGLPVIEDLGSGSLYRFPSGELDEPTVQSVVAAGVDVVTFSGDKVLGGPQAGIIVGRKEHIARIKANPMNRAMRIDKMTLAALEATLRLYLDMDDAPRRVPTLRMISASAQELKPRAARLRRRLQRELGDAADFALIPGQSRVGGGSFPERDLPTTLVRIVPTTDIAPEALRHALLDTNPPLVARTQDDALCLDPRTIDDAEFSMVASALAQAFARLAHGGN